MKTKNNIRKNIILEIIAAVLAVLLVVTTVVTSHFDKIISQYLEQEMYAVIKNDNVSEEDTQYFKSDYRNINKLKEAQKIFARDVQAQGSVLLKNEAGLPIAKNSKVTLLGSTSGKIIRGGSGSGSVDSREGTLKEAFEEAGFSVNPVMWSFYTTGAGVSKMNYTAGTVGEAKYSSYTDKEKSSFSDYSDAAIVFIGQSGGEDVDVPMTTTEDSSRTMLQLSEDQEKLIDLAVSSFSTVIVVLNTANPMEIGYLKDKAVSILWVGLGGDEGWKAIPEILCGTRYPSGRLADTYAYSSFSAPAMQNYFESSFTNLSYSKDYVNGYMNYAEGIYVGYRYYETRYADKVTGRENVGEYNYSEQVQYPFGYGISYTEFAYDNFSLKEDKDGFTAEVTVKNVGSAVGKEVVQIYMQSPYTDYDILNGVEKSAIELVGFAKTKELKPNESETISVQIGKDVLAAYDAQGAKTYIVDDGEYYFTVGKDAHDALNNVLTHCGYSVEDGMTAQGNSSLVAVHTEDKFDKTTYAEKGIKNEFDSAAITNYIKSEKKLTRSDWEGSFPKSLGGAEHKLEATAEMVKDAAPTYPKNESTVMPVTGAEKKLSLVSMRGKAYDDKDWDVLLDQMSADEMMNLVSDGGFGTVAITSINKKGNIDKDGPAGITATLIGGASAFAYPVEVVIASTWNVDIAYKMGYFVGEDSLYTGVSGWYAPACNTHRVPYGGRNYEYYSEDGLLAGKMTANVVKAAWEEKGLYCFVKHFALNDTEMNRHGICVFADEQAIREIYLKPFELAVTEGNTRAIMTSYNRIGMRWSGAHKGMVTNVLRNEWGFDGMVITDYLSEAQKTAYNAMDGLDAGTDLWLNTGKGNYNIDGYATDAAVLSSLRQAVHRILFVISNGNGMNGMAPADKTVRIIPPWQICVIVADVLCGIWLIVNTIFLFIGLSKNKKVSKQAETNA